ncbi:hypothetical protein TNCV_2219101 [Trichonephila clavipes]|nr:hypothetical protein TNCV_2219101 [Trichonephila clavipes]
MEEGMGWGLPKQLGPVAFAVLVEGAGDAATSELTRKKGIGERALDADDEDPELKKSEQGEQWLSRDPPPVVHKRDA